MTTVYQSIPHSDNINYQNLSNCVHSNVYRQRSVKSYPKIYHNLALVLEQSSLYIDQYTRHAINFIFKHYNKVQETNSAKNIEEIIFSPNYNSSFIGFNLKKECQNHLDRLTYDIISDTGATKELIKLKKNLLNLLKQIYVTL